MHDLSSTATMASILPPLLKLSWKARVTVTAVFTTLHSVLFLFILVQIILTVYHRYKIFSYRMVVFLLCLSWAALRVVMFGLYFNPSLCSVAFDLSAALYWLLYALPVCFQFAALSLFALYFLQVVVKRRAHDVVCGFVLRRLLYYVCGIINLIFLASNTALSIVEYHEFNSQRYPDDTSVPNKEVFVQPKNSANLYARVVITEGLFLIVAIIIGICIMKIAKDSSVRGTLEMQGMSVMVSTIVAGLLVLLYLGRTIYNVVALGKRKNVYSFGNDWPMTSDEAEYGGDVGTGFVTFSVAVTIWESIPTFLVTLYFRVKKPDSVITDKVVTSSHFKKPEFERPLMASNLRSPNTPTGLSRYGTASTSSSYRNACSWSSGYQSAHNEPRFSINKGDCIG